MNCDVQETCIEEFVPHSLCIDHHGHDIATTSRGGHDSLTGLFFESSKGHDSLTVITSIVKSISYE